MKLQKHENKHIHKRNEYIIYFFYYSFLGWLLETCYSFIVLGYFDNRGFLIGPICPIYGFGMLILSIWLYKYKNNKIKLFAISAIVLTFFEYATSFGLDAIFQLKWWDYTNDSFNINGRVSLYYAFAWGFISLIIIEFIHPITIKTVAKIRKKITPSFESKIMSILCIIFAIDIVLSSMQYLKA